ncbi:ParB N-terminal domain-containing protein [Bradyrhizobium tropiciagri]|uniref:ParB N-terminal domain-containing protein n=1 Tax=Bradyrhizobium tropiciagri TaxID=312253 RepID=UPI001BAAF7A4|nr:ParB N-terminal domain-containing protein [Bradyrhizobium tropiciagri]MBR0874914.1 ParB N-terminal domain-containing protein [Bradyrhizobium tropiciagri]
MAKPESFPIEKIYVPVKRKKSVRPEVVEEIAGSILESGQQAPILVRPDEDRFVLVDGLHRLEACKALGEETILGIVVSAEFAQHKTVLSESPEAEAERDKMARLKKMRLEKEAAERSTAASTGARETDAQFQRTRPAKSGRGDAKALPGRTSDSRPKTLSDWITRQKNDGGRY